MTEPEPIGDARAFQGHRAANGDRDSRRGDPLQFARRNHFGEQHRCRLQRLDLLFRIGAPRAVLHHQHADRRAAAKHGHAEEGLIDLLSGLGLVGEGRVVLGIGKRERLGARSDEPDKALARLHRRQVDRFTIEALGRKQLHRAVRPHDIERADFGHHVGSDEHHDAVQARLRGDGLRHDLAEPPQQQTGSARRAHSESSFPLAQRYVGV